MELRDIIVTPFFLSLIYFIAYQVRARFTDINTKRYFIPALTVKLIGALALGFIYDFYYQGGDTFSYHKFGSRYIWEAFVDSPSVGFKLLFSDGNSQVGIYKYSSRIFFFGDSSSYNVVRTAAVFDLFTFSTYSSTALLFSVSSFAAIWLMFTTFYRRYPKLHKWLAVACFFIPSVFFWGSGLMKDTIALGAMAIATYGICEIFIERRPGFFSIFCVCIGIVGMYAVKVYILLTFLPAVIVWVSLFIMQKMKSMVIKILAFPFMITVAIVLSYFAALKTTEGDSKYALDKIGQTAQVTAYDIRYYTGKNAGSGYSLGDLDGTFTSLLKLAPQAVNVTLFRPYIWEVSSPFMLLSSLESMGMFFFSIYVLIKRGRHVFLAFSNPDIVFMLVFSVAFAFAVGVSTFNFGTLVRYKIPLMPYYLMCMVLILNYSKSERNVDELESTE